MCAKAKYVFQISTSSGVPIYRQVTDQVKTLIATGRLEPGAFVPSVREVAKELEINPMTVSKAYSLLEKEGVLEFVRGQGMRVHRTSISRNDLNKRKDGIVPLLREVVTRARQLSLEPQEVLDLLQRLLEGDKNG